MLVPSGWVFEVLGCMTYSLAEMGSQKESPLELTICQTYLLVVLSAGDIISCGMLIPRFGWRARDSMRRSRIFHPRCNLKIMIMNVMLERALTQTYQDDMVFEVLYKDMC